MYCELDIDNFVCSSNKASRRASEQSHKALFFLVLFLDNENVCDNKNVSVFVCVRTVYANHENCNEPKIVSFHQHVMPGIIDQFYRSD